MASEMELLPCPFCGGRAEIVGHYGIAPYHVRCMGQRLGCIAQGPSRSNQASAAAAWNTRPVPAPVGVKDLEWDEPSGHGATPYYWAVGARTRAKSYRIDWEGYGLGHTDHAGPYMLMDIGKFPSIEAAKAAAQADYRQIILSALTSPQTSEAGE